MNRDNGFFLGNLKWLSRGFSELCAKNMTKIDEGLSKY
jgi:hypothetical protein